MEDYLFALLRDIWHSLIVSAFLMFPVCDYYIDVYEKTCMIFAWQHVSTFCDTFGKIAFLKAFILEISLECILYNWNTTHMDHCYMHSLSQWEICWQSKTGINKVSQSTALSSGSSTDPSAGKLIERDNGYSSRQRLPEVSRQWIFLQ